LTFDFLVGLARRDSQNRGSHVFLSWRLLLGEPVARTAVVTVIDLEVNAAKGPASELPQFLAEDALTAAFT
jgi:hypothetical protein